MWRVRHCDLWHLRDAIWKWLLRRGLHVIRSGRCALRHAVWLPYVTVLLHLLHLSHDDCMSIRAFFRVFTFLVCIVCNFSLLGGFGSSALFTYENTDLGPWIVRSWSHTGTERSQGPKKTLFSKFRAACVQKVGCWLVHARCSERGWGVFETVAISKSWDGYKTRLKIFLFTLYLTMMIM